VALLDEITKRLTETPGRKFDSTYNAGVRNIQTNLAQLGSSEEVATRRRNEDYGLNQNNLNRTSEEERERLEERMGNSGGSFSGVHVGEQGNIASAKQRSLAALNTNKTRQEEDQAFNRANTEQDWLNELNSLDVGRANREEAAAKEEAAKIAQAEADRIAADQQRAWMDGLTQQLIQSAQPHIGATGSAPFPTPQMQQQQVQQAVQQNPPPSGLGSMLQKTQNMASQIQPQQASLGNLLNRVKTMATSIQSQPSGLGSMLRKTEAMAPKDLSSAMLNLQRQLTTPSAIREFQQQLASAGFNPGPIDGKLGPKTATAYLNSIKAAGL